MQNGMLSKEQVAFGRSLISLIDSGEGDLFRDAVNTNTVVVARILGEGEGIFFSFFFADMLRMQVALIEDSDAFTDEVAELIRSSLTRSAGGEVKVWFRHENQKLIHGLRGRLPFHDAVRPYGSVEFITRREGFQPRSAMPGHSADIRGYEPERLDDYLTLLDESMTFSDPPTEYRKNKDDWAKRFDEIAREHRFEAFFCADALIGLYWRKNQEIDHLAIAPGFQRQGYGSLILDRALTLAFEETDYTFIRLYCVDWNDKAQGFYRKYGMQITGHSLLLTIGD